MLLSFCILCHRGRAATGEPSIFTRQTVSIPLCLCTSVFLHFYTSELCFSSLSSGNFQPQSIVKSLVPSWNTLVLFEVSPVSFHQVRFLVGVKPKKMMHLKI